MLAHQRRANFRTTLLVTIITNRAADYLGEIGNHGVAGDIALIGSISGGEFYFIIHSIEPIVMQSGSMGAGRVQVLTIVQAWQDTVRFVTGPRIRAKVWIKAAG